MYEKDENMKKILGILGLLIAVCVWTTLDNSQFLGGGNVENLIQRTALFGFIGIGAAFVIITGGIDLSMGSVIALTGCLLPMFLTIDYQKDETPQVVYEVFAEENRVVLTGEVSRLDTDDRLAYARALKEDYFTVKKASIVNGRTEVLTAEPPGNLSAGKEVTPEYGRHIPIPLAAALVMLISAAIGLKHGLLVTKLRLQPFVVTLCSLLIYRGLARTLTNDQTMGFGSAFEGFKFLATGKPFSIPVPFLKWVGEGNWGRYQWNYTLGERVVDAQGQPIPLPLIEWIGIPIPFLMLTATAIVAMVFLHHTIYGRYLMALGRNTEATRLSGVNTDRLVIAAYVICAMLSGFTGMMFALWQNSIQPASHGTFYELYGIAAAVLGGCSLRGGEGSITGVIIGAAVMRTLYNAIIMTNTPPTLELIVIGLVILIGVIVDELAKRYVSYRRQQKRSG